MLSISFCSLISSRLYLQFGFARNDFNRWCGCLDRKCRARVAKRARKKMAQHSKTLRSRSGLEPVDSSSVQSRAPASKSTHSPMSSSPSAVSNTMTPPPMTLNADKGSDPESTMSGLGHTLTTESTRENTMNSDLGTITPVCE